MSTTTYRDNPSAISLKSRAVRASSITNSMRMTPKPEPRMRINSLHKPLKEHHESSSRNSSRNFDEMSLSRSSTRSPELRPRPRSNTSNRSNDNAPKRVYTFSNPPTDSRRSSKSAHLPRAQNRVSSAPTENISQLSPRSALNQQKSSSANQANASRSYQSNSHHIPHPPIFPRHDQKRPDSLGSGNKEGKRSRVPKAVENCRLILFIHRNPESVHVSSNNFSPRKENSTVNQIESSVDKVIEENLNNEPFGADRLAINDIPENLEPEFADSFQLAAILAQIQSNRDVSPRPQSLDTNSQRLSLSRYDFDASNLVDAPTFRLSPRALKPNEELEAKSRPSYHYSHEMHSSSNAQMPSLIASLVTDAGSTIGTMTALDRTLTLRLHSNKTIQNEYGHDNLTHSQLNAEGEEIQLFYDATLKGFYDPKTGLYYDLTPA